MKSCGAWVAQVMMSGLRARVPCRAPHSEVSWLLEIFSLSPSCPSPSVLGRGREKPKQINVHSGFICNSQKWEKSRCPSTEVWINKLWYIHMIGYHSIIKKNELLIHTAAWVNHEWLFHWMKNPDTKVYIMYDSILIQNENTNQSIMTKFRSVVGM